MARVFVCLFPVVALLACAQSPDKPAFAGYTCCNLHFEGDWISDANWSALPMLPAGTPINVLEHEKHRAIVEVGGRRMKLGLDYGRKQDLEEWARRLVVPEDPKTRIAQWAAPVREAVHHGKVVVGMTKEQVIASVGYPPAHETPSLDAAQWRYWYGKLDSYLVAWDGAGSVKTVIAEPETRAAVTEQRATQGVNTAGALAPVSGAQRASVRRVSVVDTVSMPDKPDAKMSYGGPLVVPGGAIAQAGLLLLQIAAVQTQNAASAETFKKLLDANRIDVPAIVRAEFSAALAESRAFSEVVADEGDARFRLKVETYGIADMPAGSGNAPFTQLFLRLNAELSTPSGDIIWRQSAGHASLEALLDPAQSGEGFKRVARVVVKDLLRELPGFGANALPPPVLAAKDPLMHAPATGHASLPSVGPLPPPGTTWVYRFADRMYRGKQAEVTIRVLRSDRAIVEEAVTTNAEGAAAASRIVEATEPRLLGRSLGRDAVLLELAPYLLASHENKTIPHGLQATGYPRETLAPWVASIEQKDWERITVPAGTFQALRVEIQGRRAVDRHSLVEVGRFSIVAWYSPEVKRLLRLEHKAWSANYANRAQVAHHVFELVAYRPPS